MDFDAAVRVLRAALDGAAAPCEEPTGCGLDRSTGGCVDEGGPAAAAVLCLAGSGTRESASIFRGGATSTSLPDCVCFSAGGVSTALCTAAGGCGVAPHAPRSDVREEMGLARRGPQHRLAVDARPTTVAPHRPAPGPDGSSIYAPRGECLWCSPTRADRGLTDCVRAGGGSHTHTHPRARPHSQTAQQATMPDPATIALARRERRLHALALVLLSLLASGIVADDPFRTSGNPDGPDLLRSGQGRSRVRERTRIDRQIARGYQGRAHGSPVCRNAGKHGVVVDVGARGGHRLRPRPYPVVAVDRQQSEFVRLVRCLEATRTGSW